MEASQVGPVNLTHGSPAQPRNFPPQVPTLLRPGAQFAKSYDLSEDYRNIIVRSTYNSDLKRAKIYCSEYRKLIYK